jgi:hypothetical protein
MTAAVTITAVSPDSPRTLVNGYAALVEQSCGHYFHLAAMPDQWPKVGAAVSCCWCESDAWHAAHPPLPEEQIEATKATFPKCPQCGGDIEGIPFIKRTVHKLYVEVNEYDGTVEANSEHHDTLDEEPDWRTRRDADGRWQTGELFVECSNGHGWTERRLAYKHDHNLSEHVWKFLPPAEATS